MRRILFSILACLFLIGCSGWGTKKNVKQHAKGLCESPKITILYEEGGSSSSKVECENTVYIVNCHTASMEGCVHNKCRVVYKHEVK